MVRVLDAIQHHQERVFAMPLLQQRVYIRILLPGGDGYDALMSVGVSGAVQFFAWQKAYLDAAGPAVLDQPLHALIVPLARNPDVVETAPAGLKRFTDRMYSVDDNHRRDASGRP